MATYPGFFGIGESDNFPPGAIITTNRACQEVITGSYNVNLSVIYCTTTRPSEPAGAPRIKGAVVPIEAERSWVAQHEHDDEVGSIAIERDGDVDPERLNAWLGTLLSERGVDIFRMKGFISLAGESRRLVFQGVHMLVDGQPDREWGTRPDAISSPSSAATLMNRA